MAKACSIEGCEDLVKARGLCGRHDMRLRKHGDPLAYKRQVGRLPCVIQGCERPQKARGWCAAHWKRWKVYGSPTARSVREIVDGCKVCSRCKVDKPLEQFSRTGTPCKSCEAARAAAQRLSDPAASPLATARWRLKNLDKVREQASRRRGLIRAQRASAEVEHFLHSDVFERDRWICQLCSERIDRDAPWPDLRSKSMDHRVPLSKGGSHTLANCQAAHLGCNMRKGASLSEAVA